MLKNWKSKWKVGNYFFFYGISLFMKFKLIEECFFFVKMWLFYFWCCVRCEKEVFKFDEGLFFWFDLVINLGNWIGEELKLF